MGRGVTRFWVHTVTVETFQGVNGYGQDTFAAPQTVTGWLQGSTKLVRATEGDEVVSQSQFFAAVDQGPAFTPQSRVTLPDGRIARVIVANTNDAGGLRLPEHVEVQLT